MCQLKKSSLQIQSTLPLGLLEIGWDQRDVRRIDTGVIFVFATMISITTITYRTKLPSI